MGEFASIEMRNLESFEELNDAIRGAHREVVQLGCGRVRGYLAHLSIADLPVSAGTFSVGMRSRGILSRDRITIGMLTGCTDRVTQWSCDVHPGDVLVTPPGQESERQYHGGASYAAISLSTADISSFFKSEPRLLDAANWQSEHFRAAFHSDERLVPQLKKIFSRLQDGPTLTADAAEFWKRSIIEGMTATILMNMPSERDGAIGSAVRIVAQTENYLDRTGMTPVHISEICGKLNVSRRTLHRAFHDALGIGPVTYLQRRRLCSVHSALRDGDPDKTTIAEIALQHGFTNLGRFAGYYRALFNEYPSQTFARPDHRRRRAG